MSSLSVQGVHHWFGDNKVLHDVNLDIAAGQVVSLVGPSGCGKSTLLKAILGTHPAKAGDIYAGDRKIIQPSRDIGIVYQHYSLYDFLTAQENVAFGLMLDETTTFERTFMPWSSLPKRKRHLELAAEMLEKVNLSNSMDKYPTELSGGMRQRVAIAQALVMKPRVLLLDEPFGALDESTREELQLILLSFYQENIEAKAKGEVPPYTILIVTHELTEAIYVADRVVGLSQYHENNKCDEKGNFDKKVGATIVYDQPAPIFHPNDPKEYEMFEDQRTELRKSVFDEKTLQCHLEYVQFWDKQQAGIVN